jgi:hypothetical protein
MTLDEIKQAIAKLSPDELARLRVWFAEFAADRLDQPTELVAPGSTAEKLGRLAGRAFADFRKRMRETSR